MIADALFIFALGIIVGLMIALSCYLLVAIACDKEPERSIDRSIIWDLSHLSDEDFITTYRSLHLTKVIKIIGDREDA